MGEDSSSSIKNSTIATVVGGLIVGIVLLFLTREYILSIFKHIWMVIVWCWDAFTASYSLPGWALLIVFSFALIGLVHIFFIMKGETRSEEPKYKLYIEDYLHGSNWRWEWIGNQISSSSIRCFCPKCDATLVYDDRSCRDFMGEQVTHFFCENCDRKITTISGGDIYHVKGVVLREIDRRFRTGEYKK
jgi:hypothetical protein